MPNPENSARVSHVLGNYEIFDELGRGGMGIVYRGLDLSLDRPVAVKVLRDDLRMQSMIVNRFAREARAAASLDHPNIVQIYSVGEAHRTPYIAMELVDSEPLSGLMIREGTLPWERAFAIAGQVAAALASAHEAQIIHRDVKPPNILLTDQDKAYVTDFGIAKILSMHDQLTLDGTKLGTPQYMAPERCKTGDASASSDLYSLGVLLFQMISGRLPHEGTTATELIRRILSQPPARLRVFVPDVPEDVERLVAWLIETRPEDRPASALVAKEAMDRVRSGQRLDIRSSAVSRAIADFRGDGRVPKRSKTPSKKKGRTKRKQRSVSVRQRWSALCVAAIVAIAFGWGAGAWMRSDVAQTTEGQHEISNWYVPKNAASFLREAENIWIAHLATPGLQIQTIVWGEAGRSFILLADGEDVDASQVQRAVLSINPSAQFARASLPNLSGAFMNLDWGGLPGVAFIGSRSNMVVASAGMSASDADRDAHWFRGAIAGVVDESRLGDVVKGAFHPNQSQMLLVVRESSGEVLFEHALGEVGVRKASGDSIGMLSYTDDGARYVYSLVDIDGVTSIYVGETNSQEVPILVWQGSATLSDGSLRPDGSALVASGGDGELLEISLDRPGVERVLGAGSQAVWIDSDRLAAVAPDSRGVAQIWEVSSDYEFERRQLSFLEGGVEGPLAVSTGGQWIAAIPYTSERSAVMLLQMTDGPV